MRSMDPIPEIRVTLKNGDWRCVRCKREIGLVIYGETWRDISFNMPDDCPTRAQCQAEMVALAVPIPLEE